MVTFVEQENREGVGVREANTTRDLRDEGVHHSPYPLLERHLLEQVLVLHFSLRGQFQCVSAKDDGPGTWIERLQIRSKQRCGIGFGRVDLQLSGKLASSVECAFAFEVGNQTWGSEIAEASAVFRLEHLRQQYP